MDVNTCILSRQNVYWKPSEKGKDKSNRVGYPTSLGSKRRF